MDIAPDPSLEAFSCAITNDPHDTCIGARILYIINASQAQLIMPNQPSRWLGRGTSLWIPGGVSHRLSGSRGTALALRFRKNAFSREQTSDVAARALLQHLDAWARSHDYRLPPEIDPAPLPRLLKDTIASAHQPFALKAGALTILGHLAPATPVSGKGSDLLPAPARIKSFLAWLKEHSAEHIGMADAIAHTKLSKAHFHRCFTDATGTSLSRYLNRHRISVAKHLLRHSDRGILDIAFSCGFSSTSRFYKVFNDLVGCSPKVFRTTSHDA